MAMDSTVPEEGCKNKCRSCCSRCCFGSCGCSRKSKTFFIIRQVVESKKVAKVKKYGKSIITDVLKPIFKAFWGEVYVVALLIFSFISVILAIPTLVRDRDIIDIIRFPLSIVSFLLTCVDALFTLRKFHIYKAARKALKLKRTELNCHCFPIIANELNLEEEARQPTDIDTVISRVNILRIILAEIILLPLLLCGLIENAVVRTYEGDALEKFKFARFLYSAVKYAIFVYVLRLAIIVSSIHSLQKARKESKMPKKLWIDSVNDETSDEDADVRVNKNYSCRTLGLLLFFLFHITGQMLTQANMLGALWVKIQCENHENTDLKVVNISWLTWIMVVGAYLLPIIGTLTFFIPTQYWISEYPITFVLSILRILKKQSPAAIKETSENITKDVLSKTMQVTEREKKRNCCAKCCFPFCSPISVVSSIVYAVLLLFFLVCFTVGITAKGDYLYCSFAIVDNGTLVENPMADIFPSAEDLRDFFRNPLALLNPFTLYYFFLLPFIMFLLAIQTNYGRFAFVATVVTNIANLVVILIASLWVFIIIPLFISQLPTLILISCCFVTHQTYTLIFRGKTNCGGLCEVKIP